LTPRCSLLAYARPATYRLNLGDGSGIVAVSSTEATDPSGLLSANADDVAVSRNALTGYAAWVVNLGVGLIVTPIILRHLGAEGFGAWTLALALAGYVGAIELGLGVATVRQLASALAQNDFRLASAVAASARATYLAMCLIGTILLAGLATVPGLVVSTHGVPVERVRIAVLVVGLGFILSSTGTIYTAIAIGAGRADLGTIRGAAFSLATGVAQAAVVLVFGSLVGLATVTAVGAVGSALAVRSVARRRFADIDLRFVNARRRIVRSLLGSGWRNGAIGITAAVAFQSDILVVGAFLGPAALAAYGIAVRASTMVRALAVRATDVLVPTFAHTTEQRDIERTVVAVRESIFLTRAIVMPTLITLVFFGQPLLRLWLGSVPANTDKVLILFVIGTAINAPGHTSFVLLTGMNRLTFILAGAATAAAINLGLSIVLTWRFGIVGPVLGSIVAWIAWDMLILPRHIGKTLQMRWQQLPAMGFGELALPTAVTGLSAWGSNDLLGWRTPHEGVAGAAVVCLVYVAVLLATLGRTRRARYGRLVRAVFTSGRKTGEPIPQA
jgi:O-antigen/teichoic acid export membrane protein